MNKTKEGITVLVGQVWRDLDKRMGTRFCRVVGTVSDASGERAIMKRCRQNGQTLTDRTTMVAIRRMHKHSTGWEIVL